MDPYLYMSVYSQQTRLRVGVGMLDGDTAGVRVGVTLGVMLTDGVTVGVADTLMLGVFVGLGDIL